MHTGRKSALCCCPCYSACSYYSSIFYLQSKYNSLFFCCCGWNNMLWLDGQLLVKPIYCHYFLYVFRNRQIVVFLQLPCERVLPVFVP